MNDLTKECNLPDIKDVHHQVPLLIYLLHSLSNNVDPDWQGMYTSPSPDVAAGYVGSDDGRKVGDIKRVYLPADAANLYYTDKGLETPGARVALEKIKEHSGGKYYV